MARVTRQMSSLRLSAECFNWKNYGNKTYAVWPGTPLYWALTCHACRPAIYPGRQSSSGVQEAYSLTARISAYNLNV
jgi:hypothetical protein